MIGRGIHTDPEYYPESNRRLAFFMAVGALMATAALVSMPLLSGCHAGTTPASSIAFKTTETAAPQNPTTNAPIDTGTGNMFTVAWQAPSGTSLPYLTFYNDMKYTNDWMWVKPEASGTVRIGFTGYAQMAMGSISFIRLPEPGTVLTRDTTFGFLQGADTMDVNLNAPVSGTILEVNRAVLADYYLINQSPYDAGWLVVVQMSNPADLNLLLTAAQYASQCCPPCHCASS